MKAAAQRLIDRRKEAMEGLVPAAPMKPIALEELQERYLALWGINEEWRQNTITLPTSSGCGAIPPFSPSQWRC